MFDIYQSGYAKRVSPSYASGQRLVGYTLHLRSMQPGAEANERIEDKCLNAGYRMAFSESDTGVATNPFRTGLWRALRRIVCNKCEPKPMPLSMINFDDFLHQALQPCRCGETTGVDGLLVLRMEHITPDRAKSSAFILRMAKMGKHVIADDGICLSCCHRATKELLAKDIMGRVQ